MDSFVKAEVLTTLRDTHSDIGIPLLPRSLRQFWDEESLPLWLSEDLGIPSSSTYEALGSISNSKRSNLPRRVHSFLQRRITRCRHDIARLPVILEPWPEILDPFDLPWAPRTFNALSRGRLLKRLSEPQGITFQDLFDVRQMGAVSILDFACVLEAAIGLVNSYSSQTPLEAEMSTGDTDQNASSPEDEDLQAASNELLDLVDRPWIGMISRQDPRFREILPPEMKDRTLLHAIEELLDIFPLSAAGCRALLGTVAGVESQLREIDELTLEQAIDDYFLKLTKWEPTRLRAFYPRFGWGPDYGETLERVGARLGVTRERARQLEKRILSGGPDHPVYFPILEHALDALSEIAPASSRVASDELRRRGVSSQAFTPEGVIGLARVLRYEHELSMVDERGESIVTSAGRGAYLSRVRQVADRQIAASGATSLLEVREELSARGVPVESEDLRGLLGVLPHLAVLDSDWIMRLDDHSNRVAKIAAKVLSVSSPLSVAMIREGLHREMRFRKTRGSAGWPLVLPPSEVIQRILETDARFEVRPENLVYSRIPLDFRKILPPSERILVEVFRTAPNSVMDRTSVLDEVGRRGGNLTTASIMLTYSSIVQHLGTDLWSLRSMTIDPVGVEAVRKANALRPRSRRTIGFTWTPKGRLAIAYRVPSKSHSPVFLVPSEVSRFVVDTDFSAKTESGVPIGTLKVYESGMCGGYGRFLTTSGAEENDVLVVEFSITDRTAVLRLESEEVFEGSDFSD